MRKGYVLLDPSSEHQKIGIEKMRSLCSGKIYVDDISDEEVRPQYNEMFNSLKYGEELVIISFGNAVRTMRSLTALFEHCRVLRIRLISLKDMVDSAEEMFQASTAQLMDAIATLDGDFVRVRMANKKPRVKKNGLSGDKTLRNKRCITLYQNGSSIDDIMSETGFRSKSSVFRILKEAGIKLERRTRKKNK